MTDFNFQVILQKSAEDLIMIIERTQKKHTDEKGWFIKGRMLKKHVTEVLHP